MYTKEDKEIAKGILSNKEFVELLAKVFLEEEDKITTAIINTKTNEELGEIVRASDMAEIKVKQRFNTLKMLGDTLAVTGKGSNVPK